MQVFFDHSGRPRAAWRLLGQFLVFVAGAGVFTSLFAIIWFFISGGPGLASELAGGSPDLFFIGALASLVSVFVSLRLAGRYLDRRPFRDFGFHLDAGWWLDLGFGLFLGAFLMTGVFLTELAFGWVSVSSAFQTVEPGGSFWVAILLPLLTFLCVGVYEEMLSRGYQLRNLAEGLNFPGLGPRGAVLLAWILTSAFFGVLHLFNPGADFLSTFNIALAGLLLGIGYVLTGELAIPIGLHIAWNFFQGNVYGFPVSGLEPVGATFLATEQSGPELWTGGAFGPEGGLLDPITVLAGCLLTILWVRLRTGGAGIHAPLAEGPKHASGERYEVGS